MSDDDGTSADSAFESLHTLVGSKTWNKKTLQGKQRVPPRRCRGAAMLRVQSQHATLPIDSLCCCSTEHARVSALDAR